VARDALWDRADVLARRLAAKPPLAVQGTVKAVWDGMSMSPAAGREVPLHYTQIGNSAGQLDLGQVAKPQWEVR